MVPSIEYSSPRGTVTSIVPVGKLQVGCVSARVGAAGGVGTGSIVATVAVEIQVGSAVSLAVTL